MAKWRSSVRRSVLRLESRPRRQSARVSCEWGESLSKSGNVLRTVNRNPSVCQAPDDLVPRNGAFRYPHPLGDCLNLPVCQPCPRCQCCELEICCPRERAIEGLPRWFQVEYEAFLPRIPLLCASECFGECFVVDNECWVILLLWS